MHPGAKTQVELCREAGLEEGARLGINPAIWQIDSAWKFSREGERWVGNLGRNSGFWAVNLVC